MRRYLSPCPKNTLLIPSSYHLQTPQGNKKWMTSCAMEKQSTLLTAFNHVDGHDLYLSVQSETLAEQQSTNPTRVLTYI